MNNIKNNPYYINGVLLGNKMITHISTTVYGDVETALEAKQELVKDLKEQFGWDDNHKEVAENLGIIAALEIEQSKIKLLNEKIITLQDVYNVAESIGIKLNEEQVEKVLELYPEYQAREPEEIWDVVMEQVIHETKSNV